MDFATFKPHAGDDFLLRLPHAAFNLTLEEVERFDTSARQGGGFFLVFRSDPGLYLPQAIYPLEHPRLGTQEIFLVPIQPDERGSLFQAVFN